MKGGGIAQLVERLLCKQDVSGSSPLTSTKTTDRKYVGKERIISTSAKLARMLGIKLQSEP